MRWWTIAAVVLVLVVTITLGVSLSDEGEGKTFRIESGYAFDVGNPQYVAGYADGGDRYVLDDQPMLQEGHTYLVATTKGEVDEWTVIAGPEAVVDLNGVDRQSLILRWRTVLENQEYPPGVPR